MTKLYEHILEGNGSITLGLGQDIIKEPLILLSDEETPPQEYRDITNIVNLHTWGHKAKYADFIKIRREIKSQFIKLAENKIEDEISTPPLDLGSSKHFYFISKNTEDVLFSDYKGYAAIYENENWEFLSKEDLGFILSNQYEKDVAVKYSIMSTQKALEAGYDMDFILEEGLKYHVNSQKCRNDRILKASLLIWNIIPENAGEVIATVINPMYGNLYYLYKEFGITGSLEDFDPVRMKNPGVGILDYIMSRQIWSDNGISKQNWSTTNGMTTEEVANLLYKTLH